MQFNPVLDRETRRAGLTISTDVLAKRNEALEGVARRRAVEAFEKAARESSSLERARDQADKQVRTLGKAWGASGVVVRWKESGGELRLKPPPATD